MKLKKSFASKSKALASSAANKFKPVQGKKRRPSSAKASLAWQARLTEQTGIFNAG